MHVKPGAVVVNLDAVVRVEARQIRFKLADYYAGLGASDPLIISLPKGGYAARFERRLIEERAEPAPEPAPAAVPEPPLLPRTWPARKVAAGITLAATVTLAAGAGLWLWRSAPANPSVAVLPFANLSSDTGNQYFSDGLTDEITGELSRVKGLRVIARASAFQFRRNRVDLREAGRQLRASNILEGSVERYGDRVKIVAHLERVSDGSNIWGNTYERKTSDLFTVQSELAAAIAANLNATLSPDPRRAERDPEAHDAYMRGRYNLDRGSPAAVLQAQADFQKAIARDPSYARAYAGLGAALFNMGAARFNNKWTDQKGSEEMFRKALALDPSLEPAHSGLAVLAAGPSAGAELRYATLLAFQRRSHEAAQHLLRSEALDPVGPALLLARGQTWFQLKRFDRARSELQKALDRHPEMVQAQFAMSRLELQEGHPDLALMRLQKLPETATWRLVKAWMITAQGRREEARQIICAQEAVYETGDVPMAVFGIFYAALGDFPNTIKWLERSADRHEWQVLAIAIEPWYDKMQNEPAFRALKQRVHLPN